MSNKLSSSQSSHEQLARQALRAYGLQGSHLTFLRHSDNITFKVVGASNDEYLLRIHFPIVSTMGTHGSDSEALESELIWLDALGTETNLPLQTPQRNTAGQMITSVWASGSSDLTYCSLLSWVDGEPYHRDLETAETARQIGETFAVLHQHAANWDSPARFNRPTRDSDYFALALHTLEQSVKEGQVRESDYEELAKAVHWLRQDPRIESHSRNAYGIMHADGHKGNMLLHNGSIRLIDFSFCARGNFLFDLAVVFSDMKRELIPSCLSGYQDVRPLPADFEQLTEALFLGSIVATFTFWARNPAAIHLLKEKVPQIVKDFAIPFNRGAGFWFT